MITRSIYMRNIRLSIFMHDDKLVILIRFSIYKLAMDI